MFAPPVAKLKSALPQRSVVAVRRPSQAGVGAHENYDKAARMTGRAAAPSWDFSKISIVTPDHAERFQTSPPFPLAAHEPSNVVQPSGAGGIGQRDEQRGLSSTALPSQVPGHERAANRLGAGNEPGALENDDKAARMTGRAAAPSWDFSKISIVTPDHAERFQTSPPFPLAAHEPSNVVQPSGAGGIGQRDEQRGLSSTALPSQVPGHERAANRLVWAERGVREPGLPLPAGLRAFAEAQFGRRFDAVRLHTGPRAADAARQLGAAAYTLGGDIAFGQGFYAPSTGHGLRLLAHELTHVVQSQDAPVTSLRDGEAAAAVRPLEREAERASDALGRGQVEVRERLAGWLPLCHPIYISGHGKQEWPTKFFTTWGYSPIST